MLKTFNTGGTEEPRVEHFSQFLPLTMRLITMLLRIQTLQVQTLQIQTKMHRVTVAAT